MECLGCLMCLGCLECLAPGVWVVVTLPYWGAIPWGARPPTWHPTIFNLAGPLANPARPAVQLIGTVAEATAQVIAEAMQLLGTERALGPWWWGRAGHR